jgi:hypothetical protein
MTTLWDDIRAKLAEAEAADKASMNEIFRLRDDLSNASAEVIAKAGQIHTLQTEVTRLTALLPGTPTPTRFRMFDATVNKILGPNYEPMPLLAESALYPTTARTRPDRAFILGTTMPRWRRNNPTATMICVDDEWRNRDGVNATEIADYVTLVKIIKEFDPKLQVSLYGLPLRSQNHLSSATGHETWVKSLAHFKPLLDVLDFGTISLYVLTSDLALFKRYLDSNLRMWRDLAGSKANYPFIWPLYHRNAKDANGVTLDSKPIPATFMKALLDACVLHADGFCHWNWAAAKLDPTAPAYVEMEKFRAARA